MAEFWTITQKGFNFIRHNADKLVEDAGVEHRIAGYLRRHGFGREDEYDE